MSWQASVHEYCRALGIVIDGGPTGSQAIMTMPHVADCQCFIRGNEFSFVDERCANLWRSLLQDGLGPPEKKVEFP